jgi:hypothetical protein
MAARSVSPPRPNRPGSTSRRGFALQKECQGLAPPHDLTWLASASRQSWWPRIGPFSASTPRATRRDSLTWPVSRHRSRGVKVCRVVEG